MRYLFYLLFAAVAFKNLLFWSALWQLKEYRLDRMNYFLKTPEGLKSLFNKTFVFQALALLALFLFDWLSGLGWYWQVGAFNKIWLLSVGWDTAVKFVSAIFIVEVLWFFWSRLKKTFFLPDKTNKLLLVLLLGWIIALILFYFNLVFGASWSAKAALIINLLTFAIVGLAVLLVYPLSYYLKQKTINRAKKKIAKLPNVKIVGITGSYGKTSVKEFTYQLLSGQLKVFKTEKNNNSEMGVAQTVLKTGFDGQEVFIVEMAAYKIGEIKKICQICQPDVAILTGIDSQHSALFGSQENIVKAKAEIIYYTKNRAWLVLNYDNEYIRSIQLPADKKVMTYGLNYPAVDLTVRNIRVNDGWQVFDLVYRGQAINCRTRLLGRHNLLNISAAAGAGISLGLKLDVLAGNIEKLTTVEKTMQLIKRGQLLLIDDSYNASPTGVMSALATLSDFNLPLVIVLDDILELGRENAEVHRRLAQKTADLANVDKIILCGKNFARVVKQELHLLNYDSSKIILSEADRGAATEYLKSLTGQAKIVLFEGRRSQNYLKLFA